jgi:hypothetical protein
MPDAAAPEPPAPEPPAGVEPALRPLLAELGEEGRRMWDRFDSEVRRHEFHPFVPADYELVLRELVPLRVPGRRFLEWGSGMGVITIMADKLGFEAYGIEIDAALVDAARGLAREYDSSARFAAGSFLPAGYRWQSSTGDRRTGTIGHAPSGYLELGLPLEDFDIVYGYPWVGEEPLMIDLMRRYGGRDALLLVNSGTGGFNVYRGGRLQRDGSH